MPRSQQELIEELRGTDCRCGKPKKERETFCKSCYFSLPPDLRNRLYKGIGEGYEAAYAVAANLLDHPVVGESLLPPEEEQLPVPKTPVFPTMNFHRRRWIWRRR